MKEVTDILVCSHDCDIDNVRGRGGILVAPILSPPGLNGDADRLTLLRNSWQRDDQGDFDFNHLFPIILDLTSDDFLVADLSRMITAGPSEKARRMLLNSKTHEMADDSRCALQLKLAALFGRGPEVAGTSGSDT